MKKERHLQKLEGRISDGFNVETLNCIQTDKVIGSLQLWIPLSNSNVVKKIKMCSIVPILFFKDDWDGVDLFNELVIKEKVVGGISFILN